MSSTHPPPIPRRHPSRPSLSASPYSESPASTHSQLLPLTSPTLDNQLVRLPPHPQSHIASPSTELTIVPAKSPRPSSALFVGGVPSAPGRSTTSPPPSPGFGRVGAVGLGAASGFGHHRIDFKEWVKAGQAGLDHHHGSITNLNDHSAANSRPLSSANGTLASPSRRASTGYAYPNRLDDTENNRVYSARNQMDRPLSGSGAPALGRQSSLRNGFPSSNSTSSLSIDSSRSPRAPGLDRISASASTTDITQAAGEALRNTLTTPARSSRDQSRSSRDFGPSRDVSSRSSGAVGSRNSLTMSSSSHRLSLNSPVESAPDTSSLHSPRERRNSSSIASPLERRNSNSIASPLERRFPRLLNDARRGSSSGLVADPVHEEGEPSQPTEQSPRNSTASLEERIRLAEEKLARRASRTYARQYSGDSTSSPPVKGEQPLPLRRLGSTHSNLSHGGGPLSPPGTALESPRAGWTNGNDLRSPTAGEAISSYERDIYIDDPSRSPSRFRHPIPADFHHSNGRLTQYRTPSPNRYGEFGVRSARSSMIELNSPQTSPNRGSPAGQRRTSFYEAVARRDQPYSPARPQSVLEASPPAHLRQMTRPGTAQGSYSTTRMGRPQLHGVSGSLRRGDPQSPTTLLQRSESVTDRDHYGHNRTSSGYRNTPSPSRSTAYATENGNRRVSTFSDRGSRDFGVARRFFETSSRDPSLRRLRNSGSGSRDFGSRDIGSPRDFGSPLMPQVRERDRSSMLPYAEEHLSPSRDRDLESKVGLTPNDSVSAVGASDTGSGSTPASSKKDPLDVIRRLEETRTQHNKGWEEARAASVMGNRASQYGDEREKVHNDLHDSARYGEREMLAQPSPKPDDAHPRPQSRLAGLHSQRLGHGPRPASSLSSVRDSYQSPGNQGHDVPLSRRRTDSDESALGSPVVERSSRASGSGTGHLSEPRVVRSQASATRSRSTGSSAANESAVTDHGRNLADAARALETRRAETDADLLAALSSAAASAERANTGVRAAAAITSELMIDVELDDDTASSTVRDRLPRLSHTLREAGRASDQAVRDLTDALLAVRGSGTRGSATHHSSVSRRSDNGNTPLRESLDAVTRRWTQTLDTQKGDAVLGGAQSPSVSQTGFQSPLARYSRDPNRAEQPSRPSSGAGSSNASRYDQGHRGRDRNDSQPRALDPIEQSPPKRPSEDVSPRPSGQRGLGMSIPSPISPITQGQGHSRDPKPSSHAHTHPHPRQASETRHDPQVYSTPSSLSASPGIQDAQSGTHSDASLGTAHDGPAIEHSTGSLSGSPRVSHEPPPLRSKSSTTSTLRVSAAFIPTPQPVEATTAISPMPVYSSTSRASSRPVSSTAGTIPGSVFPRSGSNASSVYSADSEEITPASREAIANERSTTNAQAGSPGIPAVLDRVHDVALRTYESERGGLRSSPLMPEDAGVRQSQSQPFQLNRTPSAKYSPYTPQYQSPSKPESRRHSASRYSYSITGQDFSDQLAGGTEIVRTGTFGAADRSRMRQSVSERFRKHLDMTDQ